jgi:hypothetical protein
MGNGKSLALVRFSLNTIFVCSSHVASLSHLQFNSIFDSLDADISSARRSLICSSTASLIVLMLTSPAPSPTKARCSADCVVLSGALVVELKQWIDDEQFMENPEFKGETAKDITKSLLTQMSAPRSALFCFAELRVRAHCRDKDKDGKITREELVSFFKTLSSDEVWPQRTAALLLQLRLFSWSRSLQSQCPLARTSAPRFCRKCSP